MNSKQIKQVFAKQFAIAVRVRSMSSFIEARIPSKSWVLAGTPLQFDCEFPVAFRRACLAAIYGKDSPLAKQSSAGNVGAHSISMSPKQWEKVLSTYGVLSDAGYAA